MSYSFHPHVSEVRVACTGSTLDEAFLDAARSLSALLCDQLPAPTREWEVSVSAESVESLLFDFLDRLITELDVSGFLPVGGSVVVTTGREKASLRATLRGADAADVSTHGDIKAPTFHELAVIVGDEVRLSFVLDV